MYCLRFALSLPQTKEIMSIESWEGGNSSILQVVKEVEFGMYSFWNGGEDGEILLFPLRYVPEGCADREIKCE